MRRRVLLTTAGIVLVALFAYAGRNELIGNLFNKELFYHPLPPEKVAAIPKRFVLPDDIQSGPGWVFGIDVSHYNGKVNWSEVPSQAVTFAYVKASQGVTIQDSTFAGNWEALAHQTGPEPLYRGAYHFLSADTDAEAQAKNFLSVAGPAGSGDLPPCLDLEWDMARGTSFDRFSKYTAEQIAVKAKTWLAAVEQASPGRKPIIYTNSSFWLQHGLDKVAGLEGYYIWIADYSKKSLQNGAPQNPTGIRGAVVAVFRARAFFREWHRLVELGCQPIQGKQGRLC